MVELTPQQMLTMERLFAAGFRPIAIPPFQSVLCMKKGDCAVMLAAIPGGGLKMLAPPSYLVDGNLSVKVKCGTREKFVWKKHEIDVTPERSTELESFRREITGILEEATTP
jgi:hypothetical protein